MKLSKETLEILKNYASINDGIVFRPGNILRTCDAQKQVLSEVTISENIPSEFGIYDLHRFLSALSLHSEDTDMEIDADAKSVLLKDSTGRSTITYRACESSMVKNAPSQSLNMPAPDVNFTLSQKDFDFILRSSGVLGTPHISVNSDGNKIFLSAVDNKNTSTHTNQLAVGNGDGKKYKMLFKTENLKMLPGDYEINISFKGIACFKNVKRALKYWVATEIGSSAE